MKKIFLALVVMSATAAHAQLYAGQMAPELALPGIHDSLVSLSSLKGKVVLVDFWASWCGPCRASNPHLVKLYKKYQGEGFEIFGVALDTRKDKWMKAVKHDRLTYTQVIDEMGWASPAAAKYFVDEIPTSFLLDRSGKIVAIDPDDKELENRILSLLR
jgi:thiol-disulfide isomerase/thioredoxin